MRRRADSEILSRSSLGRVGVAVIYRLIITLAFVGALSIVGGCAAGGPINDSGPIILPSGDTYVGETRNRVPHGAGTKTQTDGNVFSGEFQNGIPTRGTARFPSGDTVAGEFRDGKLDGRGTYTWVSGATFRGEFRGGKPSGQGVATLSNGETYVAEFRDGRFIRSAANLATSEASARRDEQSSAQNQTTAATPARQYSQGSAVEVQMLRQGGTCQ